MEKLNRRKDDWRDELFKEDTPKGFEDAEEKPNPKKLWPDVEKKLIKSGRKWSNCDWMPYRAAELYCECCGISLGNHDIVCTNLQTKMFCGHCVQRYRREVPYQLSEGIDVVFDAGHFVEVKYTERYYTEMTVSKECYFNNKGRFIKIKGKRYYLNYMPLPEPPKDDERKAAEWLK